MNLIFRCLTYFEFLKKYFDDCLTWHHSPALLTTMTTSRVRKLPGMRNVLRTILSAVHLPARQL